MLDFKLLPTVYAVTRTYTTKRVKYRNLGAVFLALEKVLKPVVLTSKTRFTPPVTWVSNSLHHLCVIKCHSAKQ